MSAKRHPARDLPLQEEADHLALPVRLHLFAGDHDQVAALGVVDRLERAAEDVVVGDRDRAEPFGLGVVDELGGVDRAVVRPRRVHVQVGDDPRPVGERLACRRLRRRVPRLGVELLELAPRRRRTSAARPRRAPAAPSRSRSAVVLGQAARLRPPRARAASRRPCGAAIAQPAAAASSVTRRRPSIPGTKIAAVFSSARALGASRAVRMWTRPARSRGIAGPGDQRPCAQQDELPAGQLAQRRITPRATTRSFGRSSTTIVLRFVAGAKSVVSTPGESTR